MTLAKHVSSWSKDPTTKCGAVIADDYNRVVGLGFNGFPRGVEDTTERLEDRPTKHTLIVHAETNCIFNSNRSVAGCRLFVWPYMPCSECAKATIQSGIKEVITLKQDLGPEWRQELSRDMMKEAGVSVIELEPGRD